ncbi:senescence-associated family protein [Artemisia annua]|uniref:Senescence-associated family protein n=1 Tax=Artemisia annua TaxID=35608 RepID=A0A2U1MSB2_ARTAN|nr:senescence-associated family protein [Artemisia annua]
MIGSLSFIQGSFELVQDNCSFQGYPITLYVTGMMYSWHLLENLLKRHFLPAMLMDYGKGVQKKISSPAAFCPRANPAAYTPSVGRPLFLIAWLHHAKNCVIEIVIWPLLWHDIFKGCRSLGQGLLLFGCVCPFSKTKRPRKLRTHKTIYCPTVRVLYRKNGALSSDYMAGQITLEKNGKILEFFPREILIWERCSEAYQDMASALNEADYPQELLVAALMDLDAMDGKGIVSLLTECSSSPDVNTKIAIYLCVNEWKLENLLQNRNNQDH